MSLLSFATVLSLVDSMAIVLGQGHLEAIARRGESREARLDQQRGRHRQGLLRRLSGGRSARPWITSGMVSG